MNPYQPPKTPLRQARADSPVQGHLYQRAISIIWGLVGSLLASMLAYDSIVVLRAGGLALWLFAPMALFGLYSAGCIYFGRKLWLTSSKARRVGVVVSSVGGLLLALIFLVSLITGVMQSNPSAILAAFASGTGVWFCIVSLRVSKGLALAESV